MSVPPLFRAALLSLGLIIAVVGEWCYTRTLAQPDPAVLAGEADLPSVPGRHMEHIKLFADALGEINFTISLPDPLPAERMPIVMVLGGLGTGEANISSITNPGNNVIVGYDWPMPVKPPNGLEFLLQAPGLYKQVMIAPSQIGAAMDWLSVQPWADESHMSILGYSLGALAAPAAQDAVQWTGHIVQWTIIAYGGSPFSAVFAADKHLKPDWMRAVFAPMIDIILHPLEPEMHLPNLRGHFLVLEGKNDELIPESARKELRDMVPDPKTVVTFEGEHMGVGPDKTALLAKIIDASRDWLLKMGAVNPL